MGNGPKSVKWRTAVKILADEITKNRLIIFLGAGCSVTSGLPTWKELITKILDKFALKTNDTDLMRIASRLDRDFGMKFREEICDRLRTSPITKYELHKAIISLDINIFITTNYDHLLEDSFRQIGYSPKIISHGNDIPTLDETAKTIIKLHGDIDSPSSIVISSTDYRSYESKNKAFVNFLNAILSHKTILFVGTSFDDPRLRQADDYIINIYKNRRRTPYLILKAPKETDYDESSKYDIAADDFKALTEDFEDRGFSVIPIDNYEDIKDLLNDIKNKVLSNNLQKPPKNEIRSSAQQAYVDLLESNLRDLIEKKTKEICDWVRGNGMLPPPLVMIQRAGELIKHLDNPTLSLSAESTFEGYLTVADTFLMSEEKVHIVDARTYYEKANMALQKVSDREKWEERLLRVRAKLLFIEGKVNDAIDSIAYSTDNKTISIRLALMIDSLHYDEAYDFIMHNDPHPAWVHEALLILIFKGETQKAKDLFQKTLDEYETIRLQDKLDDSPYKDNFSYEKLCTFMAESFCNRAIRVSGKSDAPRIYAADLTEEAKELLQESLKCIDIINKNRPHLNLNDSLFAQRAKLIDMYASSLLKNNKRADEAARALINVRPLRREFVEYVTRRGKQFQDVLDVVISQTQEDFPDQVWAFLCIASLEAIIRGNVDNVWSSLQKAANLVATDEEREDLSGIAFEIGQVTNRLDNAIAIINSVLLGDNIIRQFLEAHYAYIMGNEKSALEQLKNIEKQKPKPYLVAHSLFLRGNHEAKNKKWKRAKKLLDRSLKVLWHPATAERLLFVLTNIPDQDANEILKLAEDIEAYGATSENIIHVKARAARIVENYNKAEQYWRELIEVSPNNVEYVYGLAETLFWLERYEEALGVTKELIKGDEKTNLKCLALACQIYEIKNDHNKAFDLLNNAIKNIENNPELLLRHIDLGYITGNEAASNVSLHQLLDLKQQGKVPENLFSSVPSDQVIDIFRRQRLFLENLNDLYKKGQIPRSLLCEKNNIPTYLDWRVRTQNLNLLPNSEQWTDFTIYSTNGLRVSSFQKRRQLVPIIVPEKAKNIVIDQHAFITLHQLGLLKKIQKRFESIYYPEVLNFIWATDQKRFIHHQLSRKKAYESLKDKLDKGLLKEMAAPDLLDEKEIINDTLLNRIMRLATIEKLILIDAYGAEEQFKDHNIKVVRLSQICEWLYSKGKLSETRYALLLNLARGELPVIDKFNLNILDDETRIVIADVTLDVMEGHGLIDALNDSGLQVVIERWTANEIRNAVYSIQFREEVGQWQQDLANIVKESKTFKSIKSELKRAQKAIKSPREEVDFIAWQYAAENQLPLFTDDRCLQMLRSIKNANKQFGTDALLTDMYAKKIISLDEYASCFLKLCKWRYRFLIPDERILLYFAKEFNKALPGQALITIAEYGRKCMEDRGLFMGMELTEPPTPLGIKLYTIWTSRWITFLAELWQDESFNEDALMKLTQIVVRQFGTVNFIV
jgi:tetratricopeptide (TPR) repeat protein